LDVPTRTVQAWLQKGEKFPNAYKQGNGKTSPWRIPQKDIDALLPRTPIAVVVEDDYDARAINCIGLKRVGFHVVACESVEEAKSLVKAEPDILVLDLNLPKQQGEDMLEWMQERGLEVPVLILTAFEQRGRELVSHSLVKQVFTKTITYSELGTIAMEIVNEE
jgi:CheY-like chemotaxis protein